MIFFKGFFGPISSFPCQLPQLYDETTVSQCISVLESPGLFEVQFPVYHPRLTESVSEGMAWESAF